MKRCLLSFITGIIAMALFAVPSEAAGSKPAFKVKYITLKSGQKRNIKGLIRNLPKGQKPGYAPGEKKYLSVSKSGVVKAKSVKKTFERTYVNAYVSWKKSGVTRYETIELEVYILPKDWEVSAKQEVSTAAAKKKMKVKYIDAGSTIRTEVTNNNNFAVHLSDFSIELFDSAGKLDHYNFPQDRIIEPKKTFQWVSQKDYDTASAKCSYRLNPVIGYKPGINCSVAAEEGSPVITPVDVSDATDAEGGVIYSAHMPVGGFFITNNGGTSENCNGFIQFFKEGVLVGQIDVYPDLIGAGKTWYDEYEYLPNYATVLHFSGGETREVFVPQEFDLLGYERKPVPGTFAMQQ